MSNSVSTSVAFVDIATYSALEKALYGGNDATTWFVSGLQKTNWFSYIPITLRHTGTIDFNQKNVSALINRSGDYVLNVWFRCRIPQIELKHPDAAGLYMDSSIRWTRNLMHNLFEKVTLTFNDMEVQKFESYWLDFNFQFRKNGAKRVGYRNMIGDIASMTNPVGPPATQAGTNPLGTGGYFSVPFPFYFTEDSGVALPAGPLTFNDININYTLRDWKDLVVVYPGTAAVGGLTGPATGRAATKSDVYVAGTSNAPALIDPSTNAHYVIVHKDERAKIGKSPRDVLIHQVQQTQVTPFKDISTQSSFDLRLSYSVVLFCFAALNNSISKVNGGVQGAEWSNYTTEPNYAGLDPIAYTSLIYENSTRLSQGSDYYSLIHPDLMLDASPDQTGYHIWSYSIKGFNPLLPAGSTNYSLLTNVSIQHDMSPAAKAAAGVDATAVDSAGNALQYPNTSGVLAEFKQSFNHILCARNWNVIRYSVGSISFPPLA